MEQIESEVKEKELVKCTSVLYRKQVEKIKKGRISNVLNQNIANTVLNYGGAYARDRMKRS